jgi:hypothetical protein
MISESFGILPPSRGVPFWLLEVGWRLDWFSHYFLRTRRRLTRDIVNSLKNPSEYSSEKLRETLGFEFREMSECIPYACEYFRKRYHESFTHHPVSSGNP